MLLKSIIFWIYVTSSTVLGLQTISLVIDTTESMKNEIDVINRHLVKNIKGTSDVAPIDYYALVPFNYPDIQTPTIAKNTEELQTALDQLTASGGGVCPENSLTGIIKALEISQRKTNIFVFTDAYARDTEKLDQVIDLCKQTQTRVVIFLSGRCVSADEQNVGSVEVYSDIAEACSGLLVFLEPTYLKQAFRYMKELINEDWTEIIEKRSLTGTHYFTHPVNQETNKGLMIAVAGDFPILEILNSNGINAPTKLLLDTKHALVVRVVDLESTEYSIKVSSRGSASLLIYSAVEKIEIIKHGFSTVIPRSLKETSTRPIPGWRNYVLITVSNKVNITLNFIEFIYLDGSKNVRLNLMKHGSNKAYITNSIIIPDRKFEIYVQGSNDDNYEEFNIKIEGLSPQRTVHFNESYWIAPKIELLDEDKEIEYGANLTLACKVTAYPRPVIRWSNIEVENDFETVLLEIPSLYISYLKLTNVTKRGTYYCEAQHAKGLDRNSIDISIHNIFDVLQTPNDKTIEYGTRDKLLCEARTSAETNIKWFLNGTHKEGFDTTSYRHAVSELEIRNMSLNDVGTYTCEVTSPTEIKRFSADVTISGLEGPAIYKNSKTNVDLKPRTTSELECSITRGKPTPKITWQFVQDDYVDSFEALPYGVQSQEGLLQFFDVRPEQKGLYRCVASNELGSDYLDFSVRIQYAPIIKSTTGSLEVREGSQVKLRCNADADPEATILWQKNNNDLALGERYNIDPDGYLMFYALWNDTGEYQCIAENEHGTDRIQLTLNVLVVPYIEPPDKTIMAVKSGSTVRMPCAVLYGYPQPDIIWEYQNAKEIDDQITRDSSALIVRNFSEIHQGHYCCIATNRVGSDRIRYYLKLIT